MANPTISRKLEQSMTVTEEAKRLFQLIYREQNKEEKEDEEIPKIKVSEMVSKMAFYYEKIRNSVDYKEEYLLRKNAIQRILKRQILIEGAMAINPKQLDGNDIARNLLVELIRAGYLSNNKIRESKISEIALIIIKYLKLKSFLLEQIKNNNNADKTILEERNILINWLISIAASEIEENLCKNAVDQEVLSQMRKILNKNIKITQTSQYYKDKDTQINIGIYRNYLKYDRDMLNYILFVDFLAEWQRHPTDEYIKEVAGDILPLREKINFQIDHPLIGQFNKIVARYTIFFSILVEVIREDPKRVYENFQTDPKAFPRQIKIVYNKKYANYKSKLWRAAIRSIIYIFITKSIFVVLLEVPIANWMGEDVNNISLGINIAFPAFLLFMMVMFTKFPSQDNASKVVEGVDEIVFAERDRKEPFEMRKPAQRSRTMHAVFGIIYSITFILTFGLIIWALDKLQFGFVSIIIFLFFLAFASFFSIRIKKNVKDLIIIQPKENFLTFIADFFYVPIISTGKWLSEKFARINVFVFFLDFIIEAPFKIFVEIAEEWTKYVKERKDELV